MSCEGSLVIYGYGVGVIKAKVDRITKSENFAYKYEHDRAMFLTNKYRGYIKISNPLCICFIMVQHSAFLFFVMNRWQQLYLTFL